MIHLKCFTLSLFLSSKIAFLKYIHILKYHKLQILQTIKTPRRFPCLYYIPYITTAYSAKLIPFSAKTNNILLLFTFPFYTITETPDFCVKVYFCLIVRFFPQSPPFQRHQKRKSEPPAKPNIINLRISAAHLNHFIKCLFIAEHVKRKNAHNLPLKGVWAF